jgi:hypothetical protein
MRNAVISREVLADEYVPYMGHIANDTVLLDDGSRAESAHDRAEHDLTLGDARPALLRYLGMSTADREPRNLLARRARLIGIAAGAGIVLTSEVGRAAVELQHG